MGHQQAVPMSGGRRRTLEASVIRACGKCGAPGYWHNVDAKINPGCYAPEKVTTLGQDYVGKICPNCGYARDPIEQQGVIWSLDAGLNWFELLIVRVLRAIRGLVTPTKEARR